MARRPEGIVSDTSGRGLERLICTGPAGHPRDPPAEGTVADPPTGYGGDRVERQAMQKILLPDEDAEVGPVPTSAGGSQPETELERLSNILRTFHEHFGDLQWEDADRVRQLIIETIPSHVAADTTFRNSRQNSDRQNARTVHDKALLRVMTSVMRDDTELFKQFADNASFKRWLTDTVFSLAYESAVTPLVG